MDGYIDIETVAGTLRGTEAPGLTTFLGVRYADAPARFVRAEPVAPWRGLREALSFGPCSPQVDARIGVSPWFLEVQRLLHPGVPTPLEGLPADEDCLVLNIWTPAADSARRPVMVWLHGGGDTQGSGAEGWTQGDRLARSGDAVVVTVNHRLGVLGYLGGRDGGAADSGLVGLFDVIRALEWVRDNIDRVGGDPDNVTVFGQSGGGGKICTLMAMPAAAGLFHRAILQSGVKVRAVDPDQAAMLRADLETTLREQGTDLDRAPTAAIVDAQRRVEQRHGGRAIGPVLHPVDLPDDPFAQGAPAGAAHIPVLMGTTRHDSALRLSMEEWYASLTPADLPERFRQLFPRADAAALVDHYRSVEPDRPPQLVLARACADAATRRTRSDVVLLAKAAQPAPVFSYRLDLRTDALGGILGAPHCLDVPLVFGNAGRSPITGTGGDRFQVSAAMTAAWTSFARTGTPEVPGLPAWPAFRAQDPRQLELSAEPEVRPVPDAPEADCVITAGT